MGDFVAAVNGKTAIEEDRMRHRRIVIFSREPVSRQHFRMIGARGRDVTAARRGDPPVVPRHSIDDDRHALHGTVDIDDHGSIRVSCKRRKKDQRGQNAVEVTHGVPRQLSTFQYDAGGTSRKSKEMVNAT